MSQSSFSRRQFLKAAGASAAAVAASSFAPGLAAPARKPNIVLIFADDLGYGSIGCQGYADASTPNIDSIAASGVRCTSGYVTCPVCSPSRAGLMTGRYQQRFGHEDNPGPPRVADPKFGLPESEKTMGDYLRAEGYRTAIFGKWHLGHRDACHPQKRGFDEFFGFLTGAHSYINTQAGTAEPLLRGTREVASEVYLTDALAREAVAFIDRNADRPFFLYLPFNAVHAPMEPPPRYRKSFSGIKQPQRRNYAGMMKAMDEGVGRVLAKLRAESLEDDTIVFFIGDNGGYPLNGGRPNGGLAGFKGDTYEGGIRVPYLVQWKGTLPKGKVYSQPVSTLDVLPTCLAAAGAKAPAVAEGVDLRPYIESSRSGRPHEALYWRFMERSGARVADWKLVRMGNKPPQLFNLADDPGEKKDLAQAEKAKLQQLADAYNDWNSRNVAPAWIDGRRKVDTTKAVE